MIDAMTDFDNDCEGLLLSLLTPHDVILFMDILHNPNVVESMLLQNDQILTIVKWYDHYFIDALKNPLLRKLRSLPTAHYNELVDAMTELQRVKLGIASQEL